MHLGKLNLCMLGLTQENLVSPLLTALSLDNFALHCRIHLLSESRNVVNFNQL